jgi:tRNA dimethylallyltransferase
MAAKPLVVIVGETASGKSALALKLAGQFNGELICADSWTVYKGFDIGTAKPSKEEQAIVPHHLLDIADPSVGFSAVEFKKRAVAAIDEICARGKLPILVGGTGLYIDSILYDYEFLPAGSGKQREELNGLDLGALQAMAETRGLNTDGIDMRNKRRIIRLLEADGQRPKRSDLRKDTLVLGLSVPKEELQERVIKRVDAMFQNGLEKEVKNLAERYGWDVEPMKGIGYREFESHFSGNQNIEKTCERIIQGTMRLAKKQRTWFKRNNSIQWLNDPSESVAIVTTFLNT